MGEIPINTESIEQKREIVSSWIKNISQNQEVGEISKNTLKDVFESFGANFDISQEEKESLKGYSEKQKAQGMHAVWGDKFNEYKNWVEEYIVSYESETGKKLPALDKQKDSQSSKPGSGRKNSGMIQFLGELTSYAAGEVDFSIFKSYVEARAKNGLAWEEDRKEDRLRIEVPTSEKPIRPSSFPPEFPTKALEFLSK